MLGSLTLAKQVFQRHDFSRQNPIQIVGVGSSVPDYVGRDLIANDGRYYATTLTIPGRTITNIDVPVAGFPFKVPGQASYEPNPWTITFRTPGDYFLRNSFERWSFETMNEESMCGAFNFPCDTSSLDIAVVSAGCESVKGYTLIGVYPQQVGPITYDQTGVDVTTFDVALQYQWWRPKQLDAGVERLLLNSISEEYVRLENSLPAGRPCGVAVPGR